MSDLSDRARELARSGRGAFRPSPADRARVTTALEKKLGAAAFVGLAGGASSALAFKRWLWPSVSILVVGAVGGAFLLLREGRTSENAPPPAAPVSAAAPAVPAPAPSPPAPGPEVAAPQAPGPSAAAPPRRDRLAEEVAMLSKASGFLNAGRASEALRALDEHQRKFPSGALTEERRGARARALCTLGMRAEAERELARLAKSSPGSPHLAQARKLCGVATSDQ